MEGSYWAIALKIIGVGGPENILLGGEMNNKIIGKWSESVSDEDL